MESCRKIISKKSENDFDLYGIFIKLENFSSLGSNFVAGLFVIFVLTLLFDQTQFNALTTSQTIILLFNCVRTEISATLQ